jgi:3-oxoacyl-[acyl-carrier-protein] synthase II
LIRINPIAFNFAMNHSVWVTGVGSLTNLGAGFDSIVQAVRNPSLQPHFTAVPKAWLDFPSAPDAFMARLDASAEAELKKFETMSTDRATAMALAATAQAWQHAGLEGLIASDQSPERGGVYWGTGMGGLDTVETTYQRMLVESAPLRPMTVVRIMGNAAAAQIALKYGLKGSNQTYSVACASSAIALGEAMWAIRSGRLDLAVVGGSEAMLAPVVMAAWGALRVMATSANVKNESLPCRPFSSERSGLVIGEGAAAFVLESERHALARGVKPLAELAGYASTCDAASLVHPAVDGQVRAMRLALQDAALLPTDIDSVNAHATGTDTGDAVEAQAFAEVFGARLPRVSATKSMHGHLLGAAGAVEAAMCLAALQEQVIPATLGAHPIDARCVGIDVAEQPRAAKIRTVLSNSFAFGGSNASLIFKSIAPSTT